MSLPDLALEETARRAGAQVVAGVDEVGRGPLAGPVTATAVILADGIDLSGLNDSKKLSPKRQKFLRCGSWKAAIGRSDMPVSRKSSR